MIYWLAMWIETHFAPPGFGIFQYITFRAAMAAITALLISWIVGPWIIRKLRQRQIGEQLKQELQSVGNHSRKAGTPTMGGIIVLLSLLLPTLLWADLTNAYVIAIFFVTAFLGIVGWLDDYLKVVKKLQKGLIARYKLAGQILVGLLLGGSIYFYPELYGGAMEMLRTMTTVPFQKNLNFDFGIFYIPVAILVITATSNAVNLTDGLDGLAIGTVGIAAAAMAVISYVSGHANFADYLNIPFLLGSGELSIFCTALFGAALGFLWYNAYPAQVFMGDTGSLALGGALGALSVLVKKELLLPILGGIFFAEALSVIIQVAYYKYTRWRTGTGKRVFLMAPLHHHFERKGIPEPKIVIRFYIVAVILAILTMATFKVR